MNNPKKPVKVEAKPAVPAKVSVRMLCILSGEGKDANPGDIVPLEAAEAARLVAIGAAEAV